MTPRGPRPAPVRRRLVIPPLVRIWLLVVLLAVTAGVLLIGVVPAEPPMTSPVEVPWLVLATAFALSERAVVYVQPDRESHAFSLTELPLVLGLCLVDPTALVLAQVVGAGAVFVTRRLPLIKLAFNLALYGLTGGIATTIFAALLGGSDPADPRGWLAAAIAVLAANTVGDLAMFYAMSTVEGRFDLRRLGQSMSLSVPFTQGIVAIALVGVRSLERDPWSMLLLLIPAMLILLAYRAFCRARRERTNMAFLHEIGTLLHRSGDLEPTLADFLGANRMAFRAQIAEFTMLGSGHDLTITRSTDNAEPSVQTLASGDTDHEELLHLASAGSAMRTSANAERGNSAADLYARRRGFKNMMSVAVQGDRLHGVLLVANRHGDVSTFDAADAALFGTLANQVGRLLDNGQLEQSLRQVIELKEQLAHRASHDSLTGLANRAHFLEQTQMALDRARARADYTTGPTVFFIDLDGFKEVNDSLGHGTGDALLDVVAARLRSCVRSGDLVARLGGDEFAVLVRRADHASVIATAERIRDRIGEPVDLHGRLVMVGASIGIAASAPEVTSVDELVRCADAAMYSAKVVGGRQYAVYASGLEPETRPPYSAADLRGAIDADQIIVLYQPIVDLRSGALVGAEALVRWQHPTDGLLAPASFIPLAERSGLITDLGRVVLAHACRDASEWLWQPGATSPFVAVNLSTAQLTDPDLVDEVRAALDASGLHPGSLLLEITETTLMRDQHAAAVTLGRLKDLGVQLAVDDFGTGYSSLAYLRRFPVDMLKIAREFTHGIDANPHENVVTHAIIQLASTLGLRTVAEGIETATQHSHLAELSCGLGQGYLFSHPVPAGQVRQLFGNPHPRMPDRAA